MPKIMSWIMDRAGCGHYRMIWPAEATGLPVHFVEPDSNGGITGGRDNKGRVIKLYGVPSDLEIAIFQRPTNIHMVESMMVLKSAGIRVAIDVDDDLELLSARHPTFHMLRSLPDHDVRTLRWGCEVADVVTCSTPAIKERLAPKNGIVIENTVPRRFFDQHYDRSDLEPHIGWPGNVTTHPDDLSVVGNSLVRLGAPVRIIGPKEDDRGRRLLGLEPEYTGSVPFEQWLPTVAKIHTGIAPLESIPFNKGKSFLKPLEMSVAGVPFVCTPTEPYVTYGGGLFADKPREWLRQLGRLLKEPGLREDEVGRNRAIAEKWVTEDHADRWREAWLGR